MGCLGGMLVLAGEPVKVSWETSFTLVGESVLLESSTFEAGIASSILSRLPSLFMRVCMVEEQRFDDRPQWLLDPDDVNGSVIDVAKIAV